MIRGTIARPAASAVIRIGASRSLAPRITSPGPKASPSSRSRCWKWLIIMMPLRATMPSTVKKPTSEPSEITPPPTQAMSTPPTSAEGRVTKASTASRKRRKASRSRTKIAAAATAPQPNSRDCAAWRSRNSPCCSV